MARYEHLPIFQKTYDLLLRIYKEVHNFPKEYKYSIGEKLQKSCLKILDWIIVANSERDKSISLKKANQQIDKLRIYVRICYSLNIIGIAKYEVLSKYIDEIGRMIGGWLKSN